jgi:hypothetical protein
MTTTSTDGIDGGDEACGGGTSVSATEGDDASVMIIHVVNGSDVILMCCMLVSLEVVLPAMKADHEGHQRLFSSHTRPW